MSGALALVVGTLLGVGALAFVLYPLFFETRERRTRPEPLRAGETPGAAPLPTDDIEARVLAYRAERRECRTCGLRPETDAIYCSTCGVFLDGRCPECGKDVMEQSAGFCAHCGTGLAAV